MPRHRNFPPPPASCVKAFELADRNKDGRLNGDEFEKMLAVIGVSSALTEEQRDLVLRRFDSDGNGTVEPAQPWPPREPHHF